MAPGITGQKTSIFIFASYKTTQRHRPEKASFTVFLSYMATRHHKLENRNPFSTNFKNILSNYSPSTQLRSYLSTPILSDHLSRQTVGRTCSYTPLQNPLCYTHSAKTVTIRHK
jgi:hypothetical protein